MMMLRYCQPLRLNSIKWSDYWWTPKWKGFGRR